VFGHAGDGNVHLRCLRRREPVKQALALAAFDEITHKTLQFGGTISRAARRRPAEARAWLAREREPAAQAVRAAIKSALDPQGLLNPGTALARS
jgi:glycolate oxidase